MEFMANFTIGYSPAVAMSAETIEADSHEIDREFMVFYDENGNATHRYKSSAVLSVRPAE